ncbi:hypothetical protein C2L71_09430 [Enteroscipio rubneri]|uniref:Uncharacterized protein n=2 Tax=Enteroscipio rubneri TaxID=2070686 RepID=A0A2K2UA01_9ACTN|nr:hypothetical protein C2L71_09430 [Enteroscipio rubneri]
MDRLQAFEAMLEEVQRQMESEKVVMDKLKAQEKEKSATFKQYLGNRLMYQRMLALYEKHGLL